MFKQPIKQIIQIGGAILSGTYSIYSVLSDIKQRLPNIPQEYLQIVGFLAFAGFMIWMIIDKQIEINKLRGNVRIVPVLTSRKEIIEYKNGNPVLTGIEFNIKFEVWTNIDIHTNILVLNIAGVRYSTIILERIWWKLWKWMPDFPFGKTLKGLRTKQGIYRKYIKSTSPQPFVDSVSFIMRTEDLNYVIRWTHYPFTLYSELVIVAGIPNTKYRQMLEIESLIIESEKTNPV